MNNPSIQATGFSKFFVLPANATRGRTSRLFSILLFLLIDVFLLPGQISLRFNADSLGPMNNTGLYGAFFEDINQSADGGLYAELIRNRSFEDDTLLLPGWSVQAQSPACISLHPEKNNLLNTIQQRALRIDLMNATSTAQTKLINSGYWGINAVEGRTYRFSFFAKCGNGFNTPIRVCLTDSTGTLDYGNAIIQGLSGSWTYFHATLSCNTSNPNARLVIAFTGPGTVWLDMVSLFPPTFNNHPNGLRPDLVTMLEGLHPQFLRFPGGSFIEGDSMSHAYRWKETVGPIETRPGHKNMWGYRSSDGLGFQEYLQLCEDLGCQAIYVANCGISLTDDVPLSQMTPWVQDVLDAIEYANGSTNTYYGNLRAVNGHPGSFHLQFIEIGNENWSADYHDHYLLLYNAIKQQYPGINTITNQVMTNTPYETWDDHSYQPPGNWIKTGYHRYDLSPRNGHSIYMGEYGSAFSVAETGHGNLYAALGESVLLEGIENNGDLVTKCSYAPLFANVNNSQWTPDAINFNASEAYATPSYYLAKTFAENHGDVNIPGSSQNNSADSGLKGGIGVGTLGSQAEFSQVSVSNGVSTIFSDNFSSSSGWTANGGSWGVNGGLYTQNGTTSCWSVTGNFTSDTIIYSLNARNLNGTNGMTILFGYQDPNTYYWWNLGGWNNTKHAIERCYNGHRAPVSSVTDSLTSGTWYQIRIEIIHGMIYAYLNNQLVQEVNTREQLLYYSCSLNSGSNELILKATNPSVTDLPANIAIGGNAQAALSGTVTTLNSENITDENSFTTPYRIIPRSAPIAFPTSDFTYSFPAHSVSILRLQLEGRATNGSAMQPSLLLYPNPVSEDNFTICFQGFISGVPIDLRILDPEGRLLQEETITVATEQKDVSRYHPGIYIIQARQNSSVATTRLIVINRQ